MDIVQINSLYVMDGGNEQSCHKILFQSLSASETQVLVQKAYGTGSLNRTNLFRWYS
jgi:hypothetical protein